jgi:hypothetical protein
MERHSVQSVERAPAAEKPSGVVYGRQRVAATVKGEVTEEGVVLHEEACPWDTETAKDKRTYQPREPLRRTMPVSD